MKIPTAQDDINWNDIDYATSSIENVIWNNVNILLIKDTVNKKTMNVINLHTVLCKNSHDLRFFTLFCQSRS